MGRGLAQTLMSIALQALLLFVPAGSLAWPQAWVFLVLFNGSALIFAVWLRAADPDLLAERMKSPIGGGQRPADRRIMMAIVLAFGIWLVVMALDARRFGWSHVPPWLQAIGAAMVVATFVGWAGVLRANRYAVTSIRLQPERGQVVVDNGPYAWVRHPMYGYALVLIVGAALLLGSTLGLAGVVPLAGLLALRVLGEEAMLRQGLPGYRDYAERVRFRLVPGIW